MTAALAKTATLQLQLEVIEFGHSLQEIKSSFPDLPRLIMINFLKSFSENNLWSYGHKSEDTRIEFLKPIQKQQEAIKQAAKLFFEPFKNSERLSEKNISKNLTDPSEILLDLVDKNNIVTIGEKHDNKSGKKLLIDSMKKLKERGVGIIKLEHVFSDTQKEMLDAYFASDSLVMPVMLKNYLNSLDRDFSLNQPTQFAPYSFTGLVVQAKRYGIKIEPIDTVASYSTGSEVSMRGGNDPGDRCLMMNYMVAKQAEENSSDCKVLYFCGAKHINKVRSGIPGLSEITNSPLL